MIEHKKSAMPNSTNVLPDSKRHTTASRASATGASQALNKTITRRSRMRYGALMMGKKKAQTQAEGVVYCISRKMNID
jgi:hypothetical protein